MKATLVHAALAAGAFLCVCAPATAQLYTCIGEWGSTCNSMAPSPTIFNCSFASQHASNPDAAAAQQACQSRGGGGVLSYHRTASVGGNQCGYTIDQVECMTGVICTGQYASACSNHPSSIPAPTQDLGCNFAQANPNLDLAVAEQYCAQGTNLGVLSYTRLAALPGNQCGYTYDSVTCAPIVSAYLWPRYYILTLIYAPPGCGDPSHTCAATNSVTYSQDSSTGTETELQQSTATGLSLDVKVGTDAESVGAGFESTKTATNSTSETITKSASGQLTVNGQLDGINHDLDQFTILINPSLMTNSVGHSVVWSMGWRTIPGFVPPLTTARTDTVYVYELKHPAQMRAGILADFQKVGMTTADYATILAQDPYAATNPSIPPPSRFSPTTLSFEYEPPLPTDPNICANGVCSCNSFTGDIKNDFETTNVSSAEQSYKVSVTASLSVPDLLDLTTGGDITWDNTSTTTHTASSSETASATIACPSAGYTGANHIAVYWDKIYGSFLFVPQGLAGRGTGSGLEGPVIYQGLVISQGKPQAHQVVDLQVGKVVYHTTTNNKGEYVFHGGVNTPTREQPAEVSVRGVHRPVTLGTATMEPIEVARPISPVNPSRPLNPASPNRQSECREGEAFIPGRGCVAEMRGCPQGTEMEEGKCVKQASAPVPIEQPGRITPSREARPPVPEQKAVPEPKAVPEQRAVPEEKTAPAGRALDCRAPFVSSSDGKTCVCPEGATNRGGECVKTPGRMPPPK